MITDKVREDTAEYVALFDDIDSMSHEWKYHRDGTIDKMQAELASIRKGLSPYRRFVVELLEAEFGSDLDEEEHPVFVWRRGYRQFEKGTSTFVDWCKKHNKNCTMENCIDYVAEKYPFHPIHPPAYDFWVCEDWQRKLIDQKAYYFWVLEQLDDVLLGLHMAKEDESFRETADRDLKRLLSRLYDTDPSNDEDPSWTQLLSFDEFVDRFKPYLSDAHAGDCTCLPASCQRCYAEQLWGIPPIDWEKHEGSTLLRDYRESKDKKDD